MEKVFKYRYDQWEYKVEFDQSVQELNALGADGWELVSAQHRHESTERYFYFKRPKWEAISNPLSRKESD